jgi:hypothetical protein
MHTYRTRRHHYRPSAPRFASGLAALAMTAIMLGIFVVVPASTDAEAHEPAMVAMSLRCASGI